MSEDIVPYGNQQLSMYDRMGDPISAIQTMGEFLHNSKMFGCVNKEQGMVIAMACICDRRNPMDIMRKFHIIENKLSMKAEAMLAGFIERGGAVDWVQFDDKAAVADFTKNGKTTRITYTIEDARRAGLVSGNWVKRPDAMLRSKLSSKGVRMIDPEVNTGVYTPEEIEDFERTPPQAMKIMNTGFADVKTIEAREGKIRRFPAPDSAAPPALVVAHKATQQKAEMPAKQAVDAAAQIATNAIASMPLGMTIAEGAEVLRGQTAIEHKNYTTEYKPEASDTKELPAVQVATENYPDMAEVVPASMATKDQLEVESICGVKIVQCKEWMTKAGWLTEGAPLSTLAQDKLEKIIARPGPFLRAVELGKMPAQ